MQSLSFALCLTMVLFGGADTLQLSSAKSQGQASTYPLLGARNAPLSQKAMVDSIVLIAVFQVI
jgi:hypothetical protein